MDYNIDRLMEAVINSIESGTENSERTSKAMTDALDSIDLSMNVLDDLSASLRSMSRTIDRIIRNMEHELGDMADEITAPFRTLNSAIQKALSNLGNIKEKMENLENKLNELKKKLEELAQMVIPKPKPSETPAPEQTATKTQSKKKPSESLFSVIANFFVTPVYAAEDSKFLDEILDTAAIKEEAKKIISIDIALDRNVAGEYADNALVQDCCNFGEIQGTSNTGGIVGTMGIESLKANGDTVTLPNGKPIVSDMVMKAVINSCVNDGSVISENDRCGGIVGNGNIGIIKNCLAAGSIGDDDTVYAGAVGGDTNASILFCIGAAEIDGKNDLGGIAGKGNNIHSNYSISVLNEKADRIGAIAGSADGDIKNNFFIDDGIGGIGGTSFDYNAEAIPYADMVGTEKLPEKVDMLFNEDWYVDTDAFPQIRTLAENNAAYTGDAIKAKSAEYASTEFVVKFDIDGECAKSLIKSYGESLSEDEIPILEKRAGLYPHWSRSTAKPIIRHTTFHAIYDEAIATITSDEEPPIILIEGIFDEDSSVKVWETELDKNFTGYTVIKSYEFEITPEADRNGSFRVHIYDKGKEGSAIGILENGLPKVIEATRDGSYLVCEMNEPGEIVILKSSGGFPWWILLIIILVTIAGVSFILYKKRRNTKTEGEIPHLE